MTQPPTEDRPGEFDIIREIFAPLSESQPGAFNLTDDAAILKAPPGTELVMTKDAMVSGVHFLASDDPGHIARKLLRVNLSDLAAMGATPMGYLLAAFWEQGTSIDWIRGFAEGLKQDQQAFSIGLLGGDTVTTSGPQSFSLTAIGNIPDQKVLRRKGARPGDLLVVSGNIGDGALGLKALRGELEFLDPEDLSFLADRYHLPQPRLTLGRALHDIASSCLDISDGLMADTGHICETSSLAAVLEVENVPLSMAAKNVLAHDKAYLTSILTGGDDYELAFTLPARFESRLPDLSTQAQTKLTPIGRMEEGTGVRAINNGVEMAVSTPGWRHF
ncbi:thiamine-phosphate kinase [Sneathiella marina]|uniref:Thiamine-monophosphate kinase n=1 Tax=Sneathiella marina TaxID=2950108 RepID=A0ABY4VYR4_9PROT|nr:thiamine-phosphate kinase [Sneathiella marina]USG60072.1 thiamine-phosphate kinase [Sneathiella marina]